MLKAYLCGASPTVRRAVLVAGLSLIGSVASVRGAVNLLTDGSFDDNQGAIPSHNIRPAAQGGWLWAGTAGIDTGDPYGAGASNCTAYDSNPVTGTSQMAFIQGAGSGGNLSVAAQNVPLLIGQTYSVSFEAKAIAGYSGVDPIFVSIFDKGSLSIPLFGGLSLSPSTAGPDTNGYTNYSDTFVATDTTEQLDIYDGGNQPSTTVTWVDAVSVSAVPEPTTLFLLSAVALPLLGRHRRLTVQI